MSTTLPTGYDTMRAVRAGIGSSVVGTGLTLTDVLATADGITLVYADERGQWVRDTFARVLRTPADLPPPD